MLQTVDLLAGNAGERSVSVAFSSVCRQLAYDIGAVCRAAASGHLGGSLSSLELMSTLYLGGHLRYDLDDPKHPQRDRVLMRGHLGPLRYPLFSLLGWVDDAELATYRRLGSRLHGHESMQHLPGVDITPSGSLGMVLSYGVGAALVSKNKPHPFTTYVFLGDGEEQEGNVSEAARFAANRGLGNLVCVLDQNGKQYSRPISDLNSQSDVAQTWRGYGWNVVKLDNGHDPLAIDAVFRAINQQASVPTLIIAQTIKGRGLIGAENNFCGYHTISYCPVDRVDELTARLQAEISQSGVTRDELRAHIRAAVQPVTNIPVSTESAKNPTSFTPVDVTPALGMNFHHACAHYYKQLSAQIDQPERPDYYFLTADLFPVDMAKECGLLNIRNYLDVGLREQHMYAMAHGISVTDPQARIHISAAEAFTFRALDQMNAAGQGESRMVILADKAGLANSRNGATHQSAVQPFGVNWLPNTTLLEPSDVEDYFTCLNYTLAQNDRIYYIRAHSLAPDLLPKQGFSQAEPRPFYEVGGPVDGADVTLVGSGITTHYLYKAQSHLAGQGVRAKVLNVTIPSALGADFVAAITPGRPCLCFYNGHGDFLPSVISPKILAQSGSQKPSLLKGYGFELGDSGTTPELIGKYGLDDAGVVRTIRAVLAGPA